MKSCRTCKIYHICVFNDAVLAAMAGDEDRYMDSNEQAMEEVQQVLAAHCFYYTEMEDTQSNASWVAKSAQ